MKIFIFLRVFGKFYWFLREVAPFLHRGSSPPWKSWLRRCLLLNRYYIKISHEPYQTSSISLFYYKKFFDCNFSAVDESTTAALKMKVICWNLKCFVITSAAGIFHINEKSFSYRSTINRNLRWKLLININLNYTNNLFSFFIEKNFSNSI